MPGKIAAAHHSLTDWDFQHGADYRSLSADKFISAPTSLKYSDRVGLWENEILCRIPATLNLPQGELRGWFHTTHHHHVPAVFRDQSDLGSADLWSYYLVLVDPTGASLLRVSGGIPTVRDTTSCYFAVDEWIHYTVLWYNGKTPAEEDALCVDVYVEVAGEWVKQGSTMYCTLNSWKDSDTNRCGLYVSLTTGVVRYFDDTEIWGPV